MHRFWGNKSAVTGVFVVVGLIVAGVIGLLLVTILRRRAARRQDGLHEDLVEKFTEPDLHNHNYSPGASISNPPMHAFPGNEIHPTAQGGRERFTYADPGASEFYQHRDPFQQSYSSFPNQYPAPSASYRHPTHRSSAGQTSIDSFYCYEAQ